MNVYFTYESRDTLRSCGWFLAISKLNMEQSVNLK